MPISPRPTTSSTQISALIRQSLLNMTNLTEWAAKIDSTNLPGLLTDVGESRERHAKDMNGPRLAVAIGFRPNVRNPDDAAPCIGHASPQGGINICELAIDSHFGNRFDEMQTR